MRKRQALALMLTQHNALQAFKQNCYKYAMDSELKFQLYFDPFLALDGLPTSLLFLVSFHWESTPQGGVYWQQISTEWQDICESNNLT